MTQKRIGFIGLGVMGRPMAGHLIRAGYPLIVHDRVRAAVDALRAQGAESAGSPREVTERADLIITMLPDSPDVEDVMSGAEGILEALRPGKTVIDMSSISAVVTRKLAAKVAAKGAAMLDAPVSGGDIGAINATLSIMVGGPKDAFDACLEVFQKMGKNIVHIGDSGAGQITKTCNQIVASVTMAAVGEALVLGAKAGVDPAKIVQAISGGAARCWALEVRAPKMLKRDFSPGTKSRIIYKDLGIAMDTGKSLGAPLPLASLVHQLYIALHVAGRSDYDFSGVMTVLEDCRKIEVKAD